MKFKNKKGKITYWTPIFENFNLFNDKMSSPIFTFKRPIDGNRHFSYSLFGILIRVNLDLSTIGVLCDILDHASSSTDDFSHIVGRNHNVEWKSGELLAERLVIFIKTFDQLFDAFLNILQSSFHGANRLI